MGTLDIIFPKKCVNCKESGKYICTTCIEKVNRSPSVCIYCRKLTVNGKTHINCRKHCELDGLISLFRYKGVIRKAILTLKYKFALQVANELSEYIVSFIKDKKIYVPPNIILVPIPLHKKRKNWRGFNQASEIAKVLAKKMGWKYIPDLLIRKRSVKPQTELKGKDREKNIKGVFELNSKYNFKNTKGMILLFDDVYTSGSTIKEAAKALKRKGIGKVWALTICR